MRKNIAIRNSTFIKWNAIKNNSGYEKKTHSDFAEYLLQQINNSTNISSNDEIDVCGVSCEVQDHEIEEEIIDSSTLCQDNSVNFTGSSGSSSMIFSSTETPRKAKRFCEGLHVGGYSPDDITASNSKYNVDLPLLSTPRGIKQQLVNSNLSEETLSCHGDKNVLEDPFERTSFHSSSESESESSSSSDEESSNYDDDNDDTNDIFFNIEEPGEALQSFIDMVDKAPISNYDNDVNMTLRHRYLTENEYRQRYIDTNDRTMDMSLCTNVHSEETFFDASLASNLNEVRKKLKSNIEECFKEGLLPQEKQFVDKERVIVSIDQLKKLRGEICYHKYDDGKFCPCKVTFTVTGRGSMRQLQWVCEKYHTGKWDSSEVLTVRHKRPIFVNDLLITSCVLLSGNNWNKIELLCRFMNLKIPVAKVYHRNQNFYAAPEIITFWESTKEKVISTLNEYSEICLCGDGRNDSPGHSSRFCSYVLMEHFSKVIVDIEAMDSRECQGKSTNMERDALIRLLTRLRHVMEISEITTDASTSIIKAVRDLGEKYPPLSNTFHSLDIWHKAKSIRKSLCAAASVRGNETLVPWIDSIINHFWHCCQNCDRDVDKLKDMWLGVLHHVCGEHFWANSECSHGELTREDPKKPMEKSSSAMDALRSVILDPRLLSSLKYYVRFRHTSNLENFNSMLLKYASKRIAFDYTYYHVRILLAALDHNVHLSREVAVSKSGENVYKRHYCKRAGHYHADQVKVPKTYPHIRYLLAKIFERRVADLESVDRPFVKNPRDPKLISPTLSMKEPPPTSTLVAEKLSRMTKK